MRYIIFGDIHGNLPALEKMLKIESGNYDKLISHGDVVNYGPWSNECVELLNSLSNIITLKGNHEDSYLIGSYSGKNEVAKAFFENCYPRFTQFETIKNYIESFDLKNFCVKHTLNDTYIFPDTDLSPLNLKSNYILGHSHYQFDRTLKNKRIINTGSIGQNRKFINVAEYIVYDEINDLIELKSFIYDIDTVIKEMEMENYPELCLNYYKNKSRA